MKLIEKYKGMDLNSISIDLNAITENYDLDDLIRESEVPTSSTDNSANELSTESEKLEKSKFKWSLEQKRIIATYFSEHIKTKMAPKQSEVNSLIEKYPEFLLTESGHL